jgi:hypothetical protein
VSPIPNAVDTWRESPTSGAAATLTRLEPYLTTDGYWLYLAPGEVPAGATAGARVDSGLGYDVMLTTTTVGLSATLSPSGLLVY